MHDTALKIGGLVMRTYCPPRAARILDVGAQDMNGTLRDVAPKDAEYTGIDHEAGQGVDIVVTAGEPWPVDDDQFDLVLATSVLEHDPAFWITFEAMCRKAKPGGHIYISAPSNGIVHRCPQDFWRFYPDSGLALKQWAERQDLNVTLVESFMAEREADMWNDFCAIFRREPSPEPLNRNYIYQKVPCTNVITWESSEVLNPRTNSQDILLIAEAREEAAKLQAHINWREHVISGEKTGWEAEREELVRTAAAASVEREALAMQSASERQAAADTEQELRKHIGALEVQIDGLKASLTERDESINQLQRNLEQRRAEIDEALADAADARGQKEAAEKELDAQRHRIGQLGRELGETQDLILTLSRERQDAEDRAERLREKAEKLESANRNITRELARVEVAAGRLHQSERAALADLASVTRELVEQEEKLRWLKEVHSSLSRRPWWWNLMPPRWQTKRQHRRLARSGLFDRDTYLEARPDVRQAGLDPLYHYINHGLNEDMPEINFWSQ